jgi:hypothetical protein
LKSRHPELELDDKVAARAGAAFATALAGGHYLSRRQLGEVLRDAGISPEGQRLPHLILIAELDGLIASGPRRERQFTYALLEERAPKARRLDREEAVVQLTRRFFESHGPAQVQDFVWWSGLSVADVRTGIALGGPFLEHQTIDGKDYWFDAQAGPAHSAAGVAHLLPNFDEYSVAYRDRTAMLRANLPFDPTFFSFGSVLSNVVMLEGRVRGAWRRMPARGTARVEIRLLDRLVTREKTAVEDNSRRLAEFLERPVEITWR